METVAHYATNIWAFASVVSMNNRLNYFRKHHGSSCQEDWERVVMLHQAALMSDRFTSPKPLALHIEGQSIDYELLPVGRLLAHEIFKHIITSRNKRIVNLCAIMESVGRALAQLHRYYKLSRSSEMKFNINNVSWLSEKRLADISNIVARSAHAYFHGDFGTGNIWISKQSSTLVIIDPIPSMYFPDKSAYRASIYYDIGHMVSTLWCIYPLWLYPFINWKVPKLLISSFLRGYDLESQQQPLHRPAVIFFAVWILDAYMKKKKAQFTGPSGCLRKQLYLWRRESLIEEI